MNQLACDHLSLLGIVLSVGELRRQLLAFAHHGSCYRMAMQMHKRCDLR